MDRVHRLLQPPRVYLDASRLHEEAAVLAALLLIRLSVDLDDLDSEDGRRLILGQQQTAIPFFRPRVARRMMRRLADGMNHISRFDARQILGHRHVSMGHIVHPTKRDSAEDKQNADDDQHHLQRRSTAARRFRNGRRRGLLANTRSAATTESGLLVQRCAAASTETCHTMSSFTPTAQSEAQSAQSLFLSGGFELSEPCSSSLRSPCPRALPAGTRRNGGAFVH